MPTAVPEAEARAAAARVRLTQTLGDIQERMSPRTIAREAAENLVENGGKAARIGADAIRDNPAKAAGVAAVFVAFLARHRIAAAVRGRKRNLAP